MAGQPRPVSARGVADAVSRAEVEDGSAAGGPAAGGPAEGGLAEDPPAEGGLAEDDPSVDRADAVGGAAALPRGAGGGAGHDRSYG